MSGFSYVTATEVEALVKGGLNDERRTMLEAKLVSLSAQLSAWYPGLRARFIEEMDEESELKALVRSMITEAGRKFINNPDGMSSETIGVFAYSRFDTEDPSKNPFIARDLLALEALLEEGSKAQIGSFQIGVSSSMLAAAPMPRPGRYSNSIKRWGRR